MKALLPAILLVISASPSAWAQDEPAPHHHHKAHKHVTVDAEAKPALHHSLHRRHSDTEADDEPAPRHTQHGRLEQAEGHESTLARAHHRRHERAEADDGTTPARTHHRRHEPVATDANEATPAEEESEHVVRAGETLGGVAARGKVPRILIAEANGLKRPYHLHAGQRLKLPRTRHHTVRPGETGFDLAMRYGVPFSAIAVANGLKPGAELKPGQELLIPTLLAPGAAPDTPEPAGAGKSEPAPSARETEDRGEDREAATADRHRFIWPLAGKVSRGYRARGSADYHDGIDITAKPGTAVRAAAAGTVIFAGKEPRNFGNLVVIDHGRGWQSAYGFLGRITLHQGDEVRAHERLGSVGHTGRARRDELHFELRRHNKPVDPLEELPEQAKGAA